MFGSDSVDNKLEIRKHAIEKAKCEKCSIYLPIYDSFTLFVK